MMASKAPLRRSGRRHVDPRRAHPGRGEESGSVGGITAVIDDDRAVSAAPQHARVFALHGFGRDNQFALRDLHVGALMRDPLSLDLHHVRVAGPEHVGHQRKRGAHRGHRAGRLQGRLIRPGRLSRSGIDVLRLVEGYSPFWLSSGKRYRLKIDYSRRKIAVQEGSSRARGVVPPASGRWRLQRDGQL